MRGTQLYNECVLETLPDGEVSVCTTGTSDETLRDLHPAHLLGDAMEGYPIQNVLPLVCSNMAQLSANRRDTSHIRTDEGRPTTLSSADVDVMSVTQVRMTVARHFLRQAYSVSHQGKQRRHKLKGP